MSNIRMTELVSELSKLKLDLREDSTLCKEFIAGSSSLTAKTIAKEMALMNWLHNYTSYSTDLTRVKNYLVDLHGPFKGVWRQASKCTKLFICATNDIPEQWPWMNGHVYDDWESRPELN